MMAMEQRAMAILAGGMIGVVGWSSARADTITVYAFDHDYSINLPGQSIVDPVINIGDTVKWVFLDSGHTTTSVNGIPEFWNSGYIGIVGETYEYTFTQVGTWWYYCIPHGQDNGDGTASGMAGTVTVVPAPAGSIVLAACGVVVMRRKRA